MSLAVVAEGLSKKYLIDHRRAERATTLRDAIGQAARRIARRSAAATPSLEREEFWALRGVSFEVRRGERLGIIGRNGAGKSTLLKILSRITEPTSGRARIRGRLASLLEVGTGFHPELSGRENVYLNGAILGMSRAEVRRRFDEIVAFAEVERFIDTPVKRYSSGMYVRLAFAVAAHLEPEILIVDEVLAVGDGAFQRKCLGRMGEAGREGRTVLFVSHNMQAVRQLCTRAIWLKDGAVRAAGESENVVSEYVGELSADVASSDLTSAIASLPVDPAFRLRDIAIVQEGRRTTELVNGKPVEILITYEVHQASAGLHVYFQLLDTEGTVLFESINNGDAEEVPVTQPGAYTARALVPANFLAPIPYTVRFFAGLSNVRAFYPEPLSVAINVQSHGIVNRAYPGYQSPGKLLPHLRWETCRIEEEAVH